MEDEVFSSAINMNNNGYNRIVSYVYTYYGRNRDKNVGFTKVETRNNMVKVRVSLKGIYTDTPELMKVCLVVKDMEGYTQRSGLFPIGNIMVRQGCGIYENLIKRGNYTICGVAVCRENDNFFKMCALWQDCDISMDMLNLLEKEPVVEVLEPAVEEEPVVEELESAVEEEPVVEVLESAVEEEPVVEVLESAVGTQTEATEESKPLELLPKRDVSRLYKDAPVVDAFNDDYFYDCVDVSPQQLRELFKSDEAVNNSFLEHGYYNFRHILFGKVRENQMHTEYFIGVPGMYCNRERFMASMFGFDNFRKSHRADYNNPYFGYWYQEI